MRQLNARQGEFFERWVAGMRKAADRAEAELAAQHAASGAPVNG